MLFCSCLCEGKQKVAVESCDRFSLEHRSLFYLERLKSESPNFLPCLLPRLVHVLFYAIGLVHHVSHLDGGSLILVSLILPTV